MKFKKLIATTMALSMVLTFSGCTSKSSDADKNSSSTQSSTTATTKNDLSKLSIFSFAVFIMLLIIQRI